MMFIKYLVVVDDDVDVHNTSEVLFRLCANTDPQRDSIFTKGPSDVLDHATSEIASGSKLGIDATKKMPGEPRKLSGLATTDQDGCSGEGEGRKTFWRNRMNPRCWPQPNSLSSMADEGLATEISAWPKY